MTRRALAAKLGENFTYLSKIESEKLGFTDYPSRQKIRTPIRAFDADEDQLLLLAEKIPGRVIRRVPERPEVFLSLADLDDRQLDIRLRRLRTVVAKPV